LRKADSENAHGCTQNAEYGLGFVKVSERYHKDGDAFPNHIVTGEIFWVSFVNFETKCKRDKAIPVTGPGVTSILP
jgi:hypothetical protein